MSGWRKRDEDTDEQGGPGRPAWLAETPTPQPPAAAVSFCSECGGRLNATAAYAPKFCTHCGHRLVAPEYTVSGLDALLQATAAAKAGGVGWAGAASDPAEVTILGGSRTLMGVPRSELSDSSRHDKTLMGAPRADLYPPARSTGSARTGAAHARVQQARRAGGNASPPRRIVRPAPPLPAAAAPTPAPIPTPPAPSPTPAPITTAEAGRPTWEGAFVVFSLLLLLAVLAAAGAFWLARNHILTPPF